MRHADTPTFPRPLYQLPLGLRWETRKGVTLVGDATHLVSPFAGVNSAVLDAQELANSIKYNPKNLEAAIRTYEPHIYDHADAANRMAWKNMELALWSSSTSILIVLPRLLCGPLNNMVFSTYKN